MSVSKAAQSKVRNKRDLNMKKKTFLITNICNNKELHLISNDPQINPLKLTHNFFFFHFWKIYKSRLK